ncbi:MAG: molybdopterin-dependent oxidoreductase [Mariniblastus sp.]|nr:molybdopterin-dependent oxidoreductase [Mariniblastus sp.]
MVAPGKWPIIGEREPAALDKPWNLKLLGQVKNEIELSLDQLSNFPQTSFTIDIHCVTRWSKFDVTFSGVLLRDLLETALPTEDAKFASFIARSTRDHSTTMEIQPAITCNTLIATHVEGQPLETAHGGPIRSVVPDRYFYKSVKWLDRIELLAKDRLGFWEAESGYHNSADPWQEQRYMAAGIDRRLSIQLIAKRDFSNHDLRSIDCSDRELNHLSAHSASLRDAKFNRTQLIGADFSNANLSNAHFVRANLRNADFTNADVEGADFSGADLRGVDFSGSSLIGSSFFQPAESNSVSGQPIAAIIDSSTTLPDEIISPLFPAQLEYVKRQLLTG